MLNYFMYLMEPFGTGDEMTKTTILSIFMTTALMSGFAEAKTVRVYILAGQSNMDGAGRSSHLSDPSLADVQTNVWFDEATVNAATNGTAPAEWGDLQVGLGTFGPEISFGRAISAEYPDKQIAIVKLAQAGTSSRYWSPGTPEQVDPWGAHVGYLALMDRIDTITDRLDTQVAASEIDGYEWGGFIWMQGEDDANGTLKGSVSYTNNTLGLFADVRTQVGVSDLPIVMGRISSQLDPAAVRPNGMIRKSWANGGTLPDDVDFVDVDEQLRGPVWYSRQLADIRTAQVAIAVSDADIEWANTDDLALTDYWHFDGTGQITLGDRMAAPFLSGETDTDGDGIPDWWEQLYFGGATNASPMTTVSNGVNTVLDAYIAGLNPTNPASYFELSDLRGNILEWTTATGRVYTVYWSSNLIHGFQPLETNLTGGSYTDTHHSTDAQGFYKIEVQLN